MRGAKSDFEIFADNEESSKPVKRPEGSRKDAPQAKSPPTATRTTTKGTTRPKKTITVTVRVSKPGLVAISSNNKENVDPLGKSAGKKTGSQDAPKGTALQSPPKIDRSALNNKNHNVLQGKSLKPVRINEKPVHITPISKQTKKTSTIPFSPLADITEAYNSKCPAPLPLSVSFTANNTVKIDCRSVQTSPTARIPDTAVHAEPRNPFTKEDKAPDKMTKRHEDVLKVKDCDDRKICPSESKQSRPDDHINDNRSRYDITENSKDTAATKDASTEITVTEIEVNCSVSRSAMNAILPSSGNSQTDANQSLETPNETVCSGQITPVKEDRANEGEHPKPKETTNEIKTSSEVENPTPKEGTNEKNSSNEGENLKEITTSVNTPKRKAPYDEDFDEECPNKWQHDENYIACTDLLEIKLGADRSAMTTIEVLPAKPFIKRIIMDFAPGY